MKKPGVRLISNVFTSGNQISHRSALANPPIFSKFPSGSMDKAKESFDTEIGSEASIKGVNNNCICFGGEDSDTSGTCFDEGEALPMF